MILRTLFMFCTVCLSRVLGDLHAAALNDSMGVQYNGCHRPRRHSCSSPLIDTSFHGLKGHERWTRAPKVGPPSVRANGYISHRGCLRESFTHHSSLLFTFSCPAYLTMPSEKPSIPSTAGSADATGESNSHNSTKLSFLGCSYK